MLLKASQNEVILTDDWLGFSSSETLDNTFLTIEPFDVDEAAYQSKDPFKFELSLELSNLKYVHQRSIVTFLDVVGNIGGFNDAIWLAVSGIFGTYSSLMFMRSITQKTSFSSRKSKTGKS